MIRLALLTLLLASSAQAFTVCRDTRVTLTMIESPLPNLECAAIAGSLGDHLGALMMMASPSPACAVWGPGRGWIVSLPSMPDWVIGREARHALWGEDYAVPGVPVFGECER